MSEAPAPGRGDGGLSPAAVAWLVAGACVSFVAFLAALAYQPELSAGSDKGANALSRSPVGFAGLAELLRADGAAVGFNRRREPGRAVQPDALFVLTPGADTAPQELARLARGRRVLVILPKWITAPDPLRPARVVRAGLSPVEASTRQAAAVLAGGAGATVALSSDRGAPAAPLRVAEPSGVHDLALAPAVLTPIEELRTLAGSAGQPVVVDARGRGLVVTGKATVGSVVADPDLLNNRGLADLQGARTAVSVVEALADGGPVVFDLTLPGLAGKRSPLKLAFAPPFLPATTCLLVLAALLGLMARRRFGPLRHGVRAYDFGKRALADSAASLLALGGREPRLAGRYAELARAAAVDATGVSPRDARTAQDAALDRIGLHRGAGAWSPLAREAEAVKTRKSLMAFATRVDAWRTEMTRGRG